MRRTFCQSRRFAFVRKPNSAKFKSTHDCLFPSFFLKKVRFDDFGGRRCPVKVMGETRTKDSTQLPGQIRKRPWLEPFSNGMPQDMADLVIDPAFHNWSAR